MEETVAQSQMQNTDHKDPASSTRSVARACEILKCFTPGGHNLGLDEISVKCQLSKPTALRLLRTLVQCGMLEILSKNSYGSAIPYSLRKKYRIGYAAQSDEFAFSRLVSDSIRSSAYEAGVELLVLNNRYSPKVALRNAEIFVRERVDLVVEFQTNQQSAASVASKLIEAGIPIIAIEIPHPGASYYGANNYRAGLIGGHALARACTQQWGGKFDEMVFLELAMAGPLIQTRLTGMLAGVRELLGKVPDQSVRFLNGNGRFESSLDKMRRYLRQTNAKRILVGTVNDPSCLGALRAFEESGIASHCLAVGQNASIEARREMRRPESRLVGSVGFFPEAYGEAIISLALNKLQGKEIPPATFTRHQLVTAENVDQLYPNDKLISAGDSDSLLYSHR